MKTTTIDQLVSSQAVIEVLVAQGVYLIVEKVALSVSQAMEAMAPLMSAMVDNGDITLAQFDEVKQAINAKRAVINGESRRLRQVDKNVVGMTNEIINELNVSSLTAGGTDVSDITEYHNIHAKSHALRDALIAKYKPLVRAKITELVSKYPKNMNASFVSQYKV